MAEVKTPLLRLTEGETFTSDADGALVITEAHTHSDILRYVVADIGKDDVLAIVETLDECAKESAERRRQ